MRDERGKGMKPYCSSRTRSCREATNIPLVIANTKSHWWGGRTQQWMELIVKDLIKEKTADGIRSLENRINNYINQIFADSCSAGRNLAELTWGSDQKSLAPDSEITRSSHISVVSTSWRKINVTHWEYLESPREKDWPWTWTDFRKIGARFRDILIVFTGKGTSK